MNRPLKILLVEDDCDDALIFTRRCPSSFAVHHVKNAEAALDALGMRVYDVCFTDYRLSFDTGLDLVRKMRSCGFDTPVVVITGQDVEALGENALLAGATDFLSKDELNSTVIQRVARWSMIRRHVELTQLRAGAPGGIPRVGNTPNR